MVATWDEAASSLPGRNEGRFGLPGDPLNLVFVGAVETVRSTLSAVGWTEIPTSIRGSLAAGFDEFLAGKPLAAFPPMNEYRLRGRSQDMNWAIPVRFLNERHHFRLWRTGILDHRGRDFWWGSANYDLRMRWRNLSHVPDPDMDRERDFIAGTLRGCARVESALLVALPQIPRSGANDKDYAFRNDGRAAVFVLKS